MSITERIPLLDARLELTRHLSDDEVAELGHVSLPVITLGPGDFDLAELLARHDGFGATVLDGIVINALRIGEQTGVQLLGPGDLLVPSNDVFPDWLTEQQFRTAAPVRLGVFGPDLLAAVYRWPRVIQGMYVCLGDQLGRLTAQLVICQLPRVDERILAMFWLLAESWGQVTPSGVRLPLTLTHETLGALIGARRPTVTLALRKLTEDGALVHQDSGWLLLQSPPQPTGAPARILPAEATQVALREWAPPPPPEDPTASYAALRDIVRRLREQHAQDREQTRQQLSDVRSARIRLSAIRRQIEEDAVRRRPPPSS